MSGNTIFLLTGTRGAGKTTAAALIKKLLGPHANYVSLSKGIPVVIDKIYMAGSNAIVVDDWQTYEEAIALKSCGGSLITIEISRLCTEPKELPMGRTTHVIENNGTIKMLELQLAAALRQYNTPCSASSAVPT